MSNAFIKISTGEYPRHEGDIRAEHPEITEDQTGESFPTPGDYARVQWVEPPAFNPETQKCFEGPPIESDGWFMTWVVQDMTTEEIAEAAALREALSKNPLLR